VNRCRPPGDGDILVPVGPVSILGTTDTTLDTDEYEITPQEVRFIVTEAAAMVPAAAERRALRVFAGARPLYDPGHQGGASRGLSRSHSVLDHSGDGVGNFVSIVGGKLTTYRLMAEHAADVICRSLGVDTPCRTAEEPLPESRSHPRHYSLGERLTAREEEAGGADADLVCECELVSRVMVRDFIQVFGRPRIDDMLRALRLGMGPCQGAFCTLRAAGILQEMQPDQSALEPVRDFLDERMKGNRPILWGDQARQFRFNEIIYREVLQLDHAP
jgi:glycerol-3-phosphate dehydrogenase